MLSWGEIYKDLNERIVEVWEMFEGGGEGSVLVVIDIKEKFIIILDFLVPFWGDGVWEKLKLK